MMMTRSFTPLTLLSLATAGLCLPSAMSAQSDPSPIDTAGPRATVDRFLALNATGALASPEGEALLEGELDGADAPSWGPLSESDRLVMTSAATAVARLPAEGDRPDIYLYLSKNGRGQWTIEAVRTLALTGLLEEVRRQLRAKSPLTPEEQADLAEIELTLSSDSTLTAWFATHQTALDRLKDLAIAKAGTGWRKVESPQAKALLAELHAAMLHVDEKGAVVITLGGVVDNAVGFLFAPDPAALPQTSASEYFWLEAVGDGWYLFRTT
jgi:hypothetical protein